MLKTSHTLCHRTQIKTNKQNKTHGDIDLEAPSPLNWLAYIVLERAM